MSKKYTWHKIAGQLDELEFAKNNIAVVQLSDKKICVAKFTDSLFAFAYLCPHAGSPLSIGFIDATCNVVCPFHAYRFSLKNGHNVSGEGYHLKTWPVETREDGIFVGMEAKGGLFGWFS